MESAPYTLNNKGTEIVWIAAFSLTSRNDGLKATKQPPIARACEPTFLVTHFAILLASKFLHKKDQNGYI